MASLPEVVLELHDGERIVVHAAGEPLLVCWWRTGERDGAGRTVYRPTQADKHIRDMLIKLDS